MTRRPPRSTLFPTRRSSDLLDRESPHRGAAPHRAPQSESGLRAVRRSVRANPRFREGGGTLRTVQNPPPADRDRKSTRLNSSHGYISYAVFCLKKKTK